MDTKRLEQLKSMLENSGESSFLLFAIAKEYEKLGDEENALASYLRLQSFDANYVGLYYHLAKLYEELEEFDQALATYEKGMAVAKSQKDQHALSELANAKVNLELEI